MTEILRNLSRRKLRNGLTILGIVIGVLALTTMGSLAEKSNSLIDGGVRFFSDPVTVSAAANGSFGGILPTCTAKDPRNVRCAQPLVPGVGVRVLAGVMSTGEAADNLRFVRSLREQTWLSRMRLSSGSGIRAIPLMGGRAVARVLGQTARERGRELAHLRAHGIPVQFRQTVVNIFARAPILHRAGPF